MYAFWNILGVWLYNLTPIALLVYRKIRGLPAALGYVWQMYYPFDKTRPITHTIVYIFETVAGLFTIYYCIKCCRKVNYINKSISVSYETVDELEHNRFPEFFVGVVVITSRRPFCYTEIVIWILMPFIILFLLFLGLTSVCCMLGSDLLFMTMASHISMLLRLLQEQLRRLGNTEATDDLPTNSGHDDGYKDIVVVVKIHQRLIR